VGTARLREFDVAFFEASVDSVENNTRLAARASVCPGGA
jgi:hypothetical protein